MRQTRLCGRANGSSSSSSSASAGAHAHFACNPVADAEEAEKVAVVPPSERELKPRRQSLAMCVSAAVAAEEATTQHDTSFVDNNVDVERSHLSKGRKKKLRVHIDHLEHDNYEAMDAEGWKERKTILEDTDEDPLMMVARLHDQNIRRVQKAMEELRLKSPLISRIVQNLHATNVALFTQRREITHMHEKGELAEADTAILIEQINHKLKVLYHRPMADWGVSEEELARRRSARMVEQNQRNTAAWRAAGKMAMAASRIHHDYEDRMSQTAAAEAEASVTPSVKLAERRARDQQMRLEMSSGIRDMMKEMNATKPEPLRRSRTRGRSFLMRRSGLAAGGSPGGGQGAARGSESSTAATQGSAARKSEKSRGGCGWSERRDRDDAQAAAADSNAPPASGLAAWFGAVTGPPAPSETRMPAGQPCGRPSATDEEARTLSA